VHLAAGRGAMSDNVLVLAAAHSLTPCSPVIRAQVIGWRDGVDVRLPSRRPFPWQRSVIFLHGFERSRCPIPKAVQVMRATQQRPGEPAPQLEVAPAQRIDHQPDAQTTSVWRPCTERLRCTLQ
jgi:hypothetical protein